MALIEDEHVVQALGSDGSHPALRYGVGSRRFEWRANLGNTNIAHPTIECGAVTAVAVMNEKSWRLAIPGTAFDHLLSRPRGGGIRRHVHVENLPPGVIDHEEHVQRSERDRSDAEEVARPDLRTVLPQEYRQRHDGPRRWVRCIYLATVLAETLKPSLASSAWILR